MACEVGHQPDQARLRVAADTEHQQDQVEKRRPKASGRMEEPRFEEEEEPEDYEIALFRKEWDLCYAADYGPLEATSKPTQLF